MAKTSKMNGKIETYHYAPEIGKAKDGQIRVAAYCRVSTLQEDQELSFETQCNFYEQLLQNEPGVILVGIYADQGLSGLRAAARPEFLRLIQDGVEGKIDKIYVKSISRFSRNMSECLDYIRLLKQHGVVVHFEKENVATDDDQLEMILNVYSSIAQNDSCSLSKNITWALERRAAQGDPAQRTPYAYTALPKVPGKAREWLIKEPEAERVRTAFRMADEGHNYAEIISALNEMEREQGTGIIWNQIRVYNLLKHEAYKGDILTRKHYCPDYLLGRQVRNHGQREQFYLEEHHEPIVSVDVFDRVGEMIKKGLLKSNLREFIRRERYEEFRRNME